LRHYIKALKLWHPDKFSPVFAAKLRAHESRSTLDRVETLSQDLTQLLEAYS
jgi:hypothetical protein